VPAPGKRPKRVGHGQRLHPARHVRRLPLARLVSRKLAGLLQVRLHRGFEVLVDPEVLGETVDLVQELLARFVVVDLVGAGGGLIAIEPVERLEIRADRRDVARSDGLGRELHHRSETVQLQLRMLRSAVDRPLLQLLRDDLPDA
jgi:hypothetical protein